MSSIYVSSKVNICFCLIYYFPVCFCTFFVWFDSDGASRIYGKWYDYDFCSLEFHWRYISSKKLSFFQDPTSSCGQVRHWTWIYSSSPSRLNFQCPSSPQSQCHNFTINLIDNGVRNLLEQRLAEFSFGIWARVVSSSGGLRWHSKHFHRPCSSPEQSP